ncbi:ABC transporter substrate-binding protein [Paradevosia shaoguanensis]|uniref:ABC transporter substrate-binding protein n=1 Tax=Paradevosia shaoguanensis TaxID=1335043 RepID=UPI0035E3DD4C
MGTARTAFSRGLLALCLSLPCGVALAQDVTLTIESWRTGDLAIWNEKLIPIFEAENPGIKITFSPIASADYDTSLSSRFAEGTAGDLIACRPFDRSLQLFDAGYLAPLSDLAGMANFSALAQMAWQTDDGKTPFCVPVASVIHGFIYNRDAFDELGLEPPATQADFFSVLDQFKADGSYVPMAMGLHDRWEAATLGYENIGPSFWKGEEGRQALISGKQKLTDPQWVLPLEVLARWKPYLGDGAGEHTHTDSQNVFTLGEAAIYPASSQEIAELEAQVGFQIGAFPPPVAEDGDDCFISDESYIGIGMNAKTPHREAARKFLAWLATPEFANLYANALPGFFPLSKSAVSIDDPLAQEFLSWRSRCASTLPFTSAPLSRGTPSLVQETWAAASDVMNGTETPEKAAERLQAVLTAARLSH